MDAELVAIAPNLCLSGGAVGADLQWGMCAGMAGHLVIHWTFQEAVRKVTAPESEIIVLSQDKLNLADTYLMAASSRVKRTFPAGSQYVNNLLRRNWYQVKDAERVYGVSKIDDKGMVDGGTAWAVAMFIDRFQGKPCEAYVYCQDASEWFTWDGFYWIGCEPPKPHGLYAGIGSRDLRDNGKAAIREILGYQKPLDL